jgi:hypothetical protein
MYAANDLDQDSESGGSLGMALSVVFWMKWPSRKYFLAKMFGWAQSRATFSQALVTFDGVVVGRSVASSHFALR